MMKHFGALQIQVNEVHYRQQNGDSDSNGSSAFLRIEVISECQEMRYTSTLTPKYSLQQDWSHEEPIYVPYTLYGEDTVEASCSNGSSGTSTSALNSHMLTIRCIQTTQPIYSSSALAEGTSTNMPPSSPSKYLLPEELYPERCAISDEVLFTQQIKLSALVGWSDEYVNTMMLLCEEEEEEKGDGSHSPAVGENKEITSPVILDLPVLTSQDLHEGDQGIHVKVTITSLNLSYFLPWVHGSSLNPLSSGASMSGSGKKRATAKGERKFHCSDIPLEEIYRFAVDFCKTMKFLTSPKETENITNQEEEPKPTSNNKKKEEREEPGEEVKSATVDEGGNAMKVKGQEEITTDHEEKETLPPEENKAIMGTKSTKKSTGKKKDVYYRLSRNLYGLFSKPPQRHHWEKLTQLDLSRNIVGDKGLLPVLIMISTCRGLQKLNLDRNGLSLTSARDLFSPLSQHPTLKHLSLAHNEFYESAGEEILRVLRVNRKFSTCHVEGNAFTANLFKRIESQLKMNAVEQDQDLFNPLSSQYTYLSSPKDIPEKAMKHMKLIWSMLTVTPPHSQKNTNDGANQKERKNSAEQAVVEEKSNTADVFGASPQEPTIPIALTSPLCAKVMQTVSDQMCARFEDTDVQFIFGEATRIIAEAEEADAESKSKSSLEAKLKRGDFYPMSFEKMVFIPLQVLTQAPHRWYDAQKVLQCLGAIHERHNIQSYHYSYALQCLIRSLVEHCGPDIITSEVRASVLQVMVLLVRLVLSGTSLACTSS